MLERAYILADMTGLQTERRYRSGQIHLAHLQTIDYFSYANRLQLCDPMVPMLSYSSGAFEGLRGLYKWLGSETFIVQWWMHDGDLILTL